MSNLITATSASSLFPFSLLPASLYSQFAMTEKGRCCNTKPDFITTTSAAYRYSALSKRPHPSYPFSQKEGTVLQFKSKLYHYHIGSISLLCTFENSDNNRYLRIAGAVLGWPPLSEEVGRRPRGLCIGCLLFWR